MFFIRQISKIISSAIVILAAGISHGASQDFRPPSVPLVACDPYFSIWSPADKLYDADTVHWTGHPNRLTGLIKIDRQTFRLMGQEPKSLPVLTQTGLKVLPTRTIYTFNGAGVQLTLTFMTPALPQDLMVYSRPVTYVTWAATSTDNASHDVEVYLDAAPEIAVNTVSEPVAWSQPAMRGLRVLKTGTVGQPILEKAGDNVRIDWGWFYLAAPAGHEVHSAMAASADLRREFAEKGSLADQVETSVSNAPASAAPVLAFSLALPKVKPQSVSSRFLVLAYDDEYSIQYFGQNLRPYWRRQGATAKDLLQVSIKDYSRLEKKCAAFDEEVMRDAQKAGGEKYAQICALAYRQCVAACKLVADANGQPLLFPKENFSNGCIGTVDVIYPMSPESLLFSPSLTKAMLVPILDYGSSTRWKFPFAPHDLGTYPHANGQVYGGGERTEQNQMPVEESGNLIILVDALAQVEGNANFAAHYWPVLQKWAEYLKAKGFDPENQLCTDDFAGHLAHNVNLSAKAIAALGAFGNLCELRGDHAQADEYKQLSQALAKKWVQASADGDHARLAFNLPGTWSQKYNLVWDRLLGLNLFPAATIQKEVDFYKRHLNAFGLPLDNRKAYTKLDWTVWSASLAQNQADFETLIAPIYDFLQTTPSRVPMTDWYGTTDDKRVGFQARSVVGGVFLPILYQKSIWKKWAGRDSAHPENWAAIPPPIIVPLVPAADTQPAVWHYTTVKPGDGWNNSDFNDSTWKEGPSGFGTTQTPGAIIGTTWNTDDIWLRREIELPKKVDGKIALWLYHDDDAEVYFNGKKIFNSTGWITSYKLFTLKPEDAQAIKAGKNLVAIHCHQNFGGQYIDLGVVEVNPLSPR